MAVTQGMDRRIIGVTWSPNGGMLFLRVQWQASVPSIPPPLGTAKVSGLPIAFKNLTDLFGGPMQEKDPETPPTNTSTIAEPITDKALEKWLYWTPHDPVVYRSEAAGSSPAIRYYATTGPEVDRATAFDPYEGGTDNCGSQMTNLSVLGAAFLNCNGTVSGWMKNNGYADVQLYDGFS